MSQARPSGRTNSRNWQANQTSRTRPPTAGQPASRLECPKEGASDPRTGPSKVIRYNHRLWGPLKQSKDEKHNNETDNQTINK